MQALTIQTSKARTTIASEVRLPIILAVMATAT